jgi:serine/threonine protein phosphatase PrpC
MLFRRHRTAVTVPAGAASRTCPAATPRTSTATLPSAVLTCTQPATEKPAPKRVVLDWGSASRGAHRDHNEDSFCTAAPIFVVADGIGGHAAGELASSAVVASLATLSGRDEITDAQIGACITEARKRIGQLDTGEGKPPGSTLTGVVVTEGENPCWTVLNIGDSRTYLLDADSLTQLTADHSIAQELVDHGAISVPDARSHRYAHVLTRAILHAEAHPLDVSQIPLHRGDRILVCSDGVSGPLDNDVLADLLCLHADPREAAVAIVAAVVDAGGTDDATALVIDAVDVR